MIVQLLIQDYGCIEIELMPQFAPKSVKHFIRIVESGVMTHQKIMRIAPDFVLQFTYNEFNEDSFCSYVIEGEFEANGFRNDLKFDRYVVGLGGDGQSISSPADFFITISDNANERLDGKFTAIGKVIKGQDIVDSITQVATRKIIVDDPNVVIMEPVVPIYLEKATIIEGKENSCKE